MQYFSKMMQRMTVNFHQVSRRKLVWALVDERLNWKTEIKLPDLPILSLNFMLDMQFSLYYIVIKSNNIIMTRIQLQNLMGMEELMGINPGFIFTSFLTTVAKKFHSFGVNKIYLIYIQWSYMCFCISIMSANPV